MVIKKLKCIVGEMVLSGWLVLRALIPQSSTSGEALFVSRVVYGAGCSRLRILVAGGDGTVVWILKTIQDLGLEPAPHVAVLPLGTGNDLALSFGWGNTLLDSWLKDHENTYNMLRRVAEAEPRTLDSWRIDLRAGALAAGFPLSGKLEVDQGM
jgi:Diacylglycerol kinase catalytic domain